MSKLSFQGFKQICGGAADEGGGAVEGVLARLREGVVES